MLRRRLKRTVLVLVLLPLCLLLAGFVIPEPFTMPVKHAGRASFDQRSFWYHPWGKSVTHKGVDIFAKAGTPVLSATPGLVLFTGTLGRGGKVTLVLGPRWRFHYYAHLNEFRTVPGAWLSCGEQLGTVGNTGNAAGRPSHLHYTIRSLFPRPWLNDHGPHGGRRMWFVDPTPLLNGATSRPPRGRIPS